MPTLICNTCLKKLCDLYEFYENCLRPANEKLNQLLSSKVSQSYQIHNNNSHNYQPIIPLLNKKLKAPKKHPCKICSKLLSKHSLESHMQIHKHFCEICQQSFKCSTKIENLHKKMHEKNICYFCSYGFVDRNDLIQHVSTVHFNQKSTISNSKQFSCVQCSIKVTTRESLNRHYKIFHNITKFHVFCEICREPPYDTHEKFIKHIDAVHSKTNKKSNTAATLVINNFVDSTSSMFEEFLDETFVDTTTAAEDLLFNQLLVDNDSATQQLLTDKDLHDITEHLSAVPSLTKEMPFDDNQLIEQRYKCPKCMVKSYDKQYQLILHMAHEHNEFVLCCNECGAAFNRLSNLNNHRHDHQIDNHLIDVISMLDDKKFDNIEIVEDPKKQQQVIYRCRLCTKTFHRKKIVEQHKCSEQLKPLPPIAEKRHGQNMHQNHKPLICSMCAKRFKTTNGLKYHLKTHTGTKPLTCPYNECNLKFTAKINLNLHIRNVHSSIKLFKCDECSRTFTSNDHMTKHKISKHQTLKKYSCNICEKKYFQQSHLMQHNWIHTGVKKYSCNLCTKEYTSSTSLKKHNAKMHPSS